MRVRLAAVIPEPMMMMSACDGHGDWSLLIFEGCESQKGAVED